MMLRVSIALACSAVLVSATPAAATDAGPTVTFTKDVAPIFQQKCESCHRPNSMAPMSLLTYEEARPWAKSIAARVGARQMPPWNIDKTIGIQKFKNDRSLSDEEIETIVQWVAHGSPKGDPQEMPAPRVWADESGWNMADKYGEPDLVVTSPNFTMPAVAQDTLSRPMNATGISEPRWVRAIEMRPVGKNAGKITHHALARLRQQEDMDPALFTNDPDVVGDGLFSEWAVGKNGEEMRPDSGRLMLPGSQIVWELHYHAVGEDVTARTELAVWFYPKGQEPKHRELLGLFNTFSENVPGQRSLDIPPNQVTTTESFVTLTRSARIENLQAHMHQRGKIMSMEAVYPDGRREMLSQITDYNYNWENMYVYADDVAPLLPKGTILHLQAVYDNTKANKANPDPDQWVGWGDRSVDEMGHAYLNITYYNDDEFKAETAARAARAVNTTAEQQR